MAHTFANLLAHVIFSTNNREAWITPDLKVGLLPYQDEHHRHLTFQEEFVAFLRRHGIAYDERYIWE